MKQALITTLMIVLAITMLSCGTGSKGKTLATVGGKDITEGELDLIANINPRIKAQMASEFGKKKILDNLVEQELFYQASVKEGLHRDPAVKDKIDIYRKVIISQAFMDEKLNEKAKKYYEDHKNEFEKLKLSHIYVGFGEGEKGKDKKAKGKLRGEKEALDLANKIKARIEGGEDFAEVAKKSSEDTMTNKRGGDLGFTSKDEPRLTRRGFGPLLEKAFTAKVGVVEGPVKTEKGYSLILVTSGSELQPFDEVSQGILFKIRADARNEILADLKKKTKVEYITEKKADLEKAKPEEKKEEEPKAEEIKAEEKKEDAKK